MSIQVIGLNNTGYSVGFSHGSRIVVEEPLPIEELKSAIKELLRREEFSSFKVDSVPPKLVSIFVDTLFEMYWEKSHPLENEPVDTGI